MASPARAMAIIHNPEKGDGQTRVVGTAPVVGQTARARTRATTTRPMTPRATRGKARKERAKPRIPTRAESVENLGIGEMSAG